MVTDEMVEKAANAIAEKCGYVWPGNFDAEEIKIGRENMRAALEAALSAAEPVPTKLRMIVSHATMGQTDGEGLSTNDICVKITALRNELFKRAQSTAPSVAVKALEWDPFRAETPFGYYHIDDQTDRTPEELAGRLPFLLSGSMLDLSRHSRHETLQEARAAAQTDYKARIRSALSAQVQDVAMVTRESALKAISHVNGNNGRGRREEAVMMLAAAPEKQDGEPYEERLLDRCRFESGSLTEARWTVPAIAASKPAGDARLAEKAPAKQEASHVTSQ